MNSDEIYDKCEEKLRTIKDNDDFVLGVISMAWTDENLLKIIDYIEQNPNVDDQTLGFIAYEMHQKLEHPKGKNGKVIT